MRKKLICAICFALVCTSGCGSGSISNTSISDDTETKESVEDDTTDSSVYDQMEEDVYDEDSEVTNIQDKYLKAMQDNSGSEMYDISVDKDVTQLEYRENESDMQELLDRLTKALKNLYGDDFKIDYEQSSFEEFDIAKLQQAVNTENDGEDDIDSVESLNKEIVNLIDSQCNLQRCIKSDMTFVMTGSKKENTQTVESFIYKIDDQYYTDTSALADLTYEQEHVIRDSDSSNSEYDDNEDDEDDEDEDRSDYSSLLLKN